MNFDQTYSSENSYEKPQTQPTQNFRSHRGGKENQNHLNSYSQNPHNEMQQKRQVESKAPSGG